MRNKKFAHGACQSLMMSLVFFVVIEAKAAEVPAGEIVRKSDEARAPKIPFSFQANVTNYNGSESQNNIYRVSIKGTELSLIDQLEPVRMVGRKLLMKGHDLWLYTPEIKRPTRIGFEQRLTGEVSNGDLARTRFYEDYTASLTGQETIDGKPCYKLHLTAKDNSVTYRQIDYWVEKVTFLPKKALFYAISGKLLKSAAYSNFKLILGHSRMTKTLIRDAVQPTKQSIMIYTGQKAENFDDSFFNKESFGE